MKVLSDVLIRLKRQATAWNNLATADEFAGLDLDGFNGAIANFQTAMDDLLAAQTALKGQIKSAREAAKHAMQISKRVALAMKSHPSHGEDSEIVRASGFVTESERRSGLTRKLKVVPQPGDPRSA